MALNGVKHYVDVLIIGAGPTGLTLACDLARRGIPALVIEQAERLFPGSRGKGLQPRTQEVFDDLGIIEAALAAGAPYPRMRRWEDGEPRGDWDLLERFPATEHAPYAEPLMVPQWRTQAILHERLRELGGSVVFGERLVGLCQDEEGVEARLASGRTVRAAYLVGTDGGRSTVRQEVGIPMTGETVDPHPMLVADVRLTGLDRDRWHVFPKARGGGFALCPLAGTDHFQLQAQYERPDARPDTSVEGVRRLVAERTHLSAADVLEVLWASEFRARAAMADRFRSGRVFLAGDAAHIHSPVGGQGLNTSVQDAYNLGWKLGHVLRYGASDALLDSYEEERLPVAAQVLGISTELHRAARLTDDSPATRRGVRTRQLDLGYRGSSLAMERRREVPEDGLRAGDRAPDALLSGGSGGPARLFDLFRGPHFTLLAFGDAPLPAPNGDWLRAHRIPATARGAHGAYADHGLFLVRPDGYVGLATTELADLAAYGPLTAAGAAARGAGA
ncbi:FAD-dependent monooxygenase [Streptomyces sp. URMC 123]|uniref:FAD-dependent monooxygenase n=1 Tax=Streptomyces sp. URMC 123 TaxID=3423403 RepID=UPI003F1A7BFC